MLILLLHWATITSKSLVFRRAALSRGEVPTPRGDQARAGTAGIIPATTPATEQLASPIGDDDGLLCVGAQHSRALQRPGRPPGPRTVAITAGSGSGGGRVARHGQPVTFQARPRETTSKSRLTLPRRTSLFGGQPSTDLPPGLKSALAARWCGSPRREFEQGEHY